MKSTTLSITSLICTFVLTLISMQIFGQDIITKTNGIVIKADVREINPKNIKFQYYGQTNTELTTLKNKDIATIEYENGMVVNFNPVHTSGKSGHSSATKMNAIGVNPIMLLVGLDVGIGTLDYERYLGDMLSVGGRIVHYTKEEYRYYEEATGIGVFFRKYFNNDQGLKGFYIGSSLDIVGVSWTDVWYSGPTDRNVEEGSGVALVAMSQIGYKINIGDMFFAEPMLSLGFYNSTTESDRNSYNEFGLVYTPALSIGIKF